MIINLRTLFKQEYSAEFELYNVIYRIRNTINGKSYIGQAKDFLNRFLYSDFSHYNRYVESCIVGNTSTYLYNALKKYKSRVFDVIILEHSLNKDELNDREEYYIRFYHTCRFDPLFHGYNMTYGGEDASQLHTSEVRSRAVITTRIRSKEKYGRAYGWLFTPESIAARIESDKRNHGGKMALNSDDSVRRRTATNRNNNGGVLSINTDSAKLRSHEVLAERYGTPAGRLLDPEVRAKALEIQKSNHDGKLACNTPESVEKSVATQMLNYNGKLAFNTEKSYETNRANHGGVLSMHTEQGVQNSRLGHWFSYSNRYINDLKVINSESYYKRSTWSHLYYLRDHYDTIKEDSRLDPRIKPLLESIISLIPTTIENQEGE